MANEGQLFPVSNLPGFVIPSEIRLVAADNDHVLMVESEDIPYLITKANSGGSGGTSLTYVSDGDTNGLAYFIGTGKGTTAWQNPEGNGLIVTCSSLGRGSLQLLLDRQPSDVWTYISDPNSSFTISITTGHLKCNYYSIRNKIDPNFYPRNWFFEASNDGTNWTTLDTQLGNTSLNSPSQWLSLPVSSDVYYSQFRLRTAGSNSSGYGFLGLGEVELYGDYQLS